jgi:hypothetical protein
MSDLNAKAKGEGEGVIREVSPANQSGLVAGDLALADILAALAEDIADQTTRRRRPR